MSDPSSNINNESGKDPASHDPAQPQESSSSPLLQQSSPHVRYESNNTDQESVPTSITVSQCSSISNELTPLLSAREVPQSSLFRKLFIPHWLHAVFVATIIFIGLTVITFNNIQSVVNDAIDLRVHNATFANFTSQGVNVHVQGSVEMKYHLMRTNFVQVAMIKTGAFVLGALKLSSKKPVQLHVQLVDLKSPFLYLADTSPPPITIHVGNRAKTELNFVTECTFGNTEFLDFLKYYYQLTGDDINLRVKMIAEEVNVNTLRLLNLKLYNVEVSDYLTISKKDLKSGLKINQFGVTSPKANTINLSAQLELPNQFGVSLDLPTLKWGILFSDCDSNLLRVGEWRTLPTQVGKDCPVRVNVEGVVMDVPTELMDDCRDSVSPINSLIDQYLREKPIKFYLQLSSDQTFDDVPHDLRWIFDTLQRIPPAELAVLLPRINLASDISVKLSELAMNYTGGKSAEWLMQDGLAIAGNVRGNFSIKANAPASLEVDVERLKFNVSLGSSNATLMQGWSRDFVLLRTEHTKHHVSADVSVSDFDVSITDPVFLGRVVNDVINREDKSNFLNDDVYLNISLSQVDMSLPIVGNATLKDLNVPFVKVPKALSLLQEVSGLKFGSVIHELDVSIEEVYFLSSSEHEAEFQVLVSLYNPFNISMEIPPVPDQQIMVGFGQNKTKFGYASFGQVSLTKHERSELEVNVKFQYQSYSDKLFLQDFVSVYISSFTKDLSIDLTNNSVVGNPGLDAFMSQVKVQDITMPNVSFTIPEYSVGEKKTVSLRESPRQQQRQQQKQDAGAFIIETTIHLFTSEIELKIYNPISNAEVRLEVFQAFAKHEDVVLGYTSRREVIDIQPGFYVTPRIPIKIENGAASDILKRALNGDLSIDVMADVNVGFGLFELRLIYKGKQLVSKIRL
ncbi:hypothetical protein KGF57_003565 [Candida theae]|uniref:Tag1-like fifth Ig-like domain-containing protein n=1 Tax=Candida theae TaxID=1198502 RepID=A0AAD5BD45_9ASCO|nr:uncharacterized protein KGF57_003565 [Candida theae]KAI5956079.1 hypothetical protein KGF57_003565 [Candida theae]